MGGKLVAWIRGHKTVSAIGAAGGGLVALVVIKRKSSSSSTSATSPATSTSSGVPSDPAAYTASNDYTDAYDAAMAGVSDALSQFDFSNSGSTGGGSTGGGGGSGGGTGGGGSGGGKKGKNPNAHSWTDTGQSWTAAQLARYLGVPLSALRASDASGAKGLVNPNAPLAKGASFTFLQTPAQAAAGQKTRPVVKRPVTIRKKPGRA